MKIVLILIPFAVVICALIDAIYTLRLSADYGIYFLEYVYSGRLFSEEEPVYPKRWSGNSLEEVVDKAIKFFENSFIKYKIVKY